MQNLMMNKKEDGCALPALNWMWFPKILQHLKVIAGTLTGDYIWFSFTWLLLQLLVVFIIVVSMKIMISIS